MKSQSNGKSVKDFARSLRGFEKYATNEALEEGLLLIKFLSGWENSLRDKEKDLDNREKRLKSDYSALISAKREVAKRQ